MLCLRRSLPFRLCYLCHLISWCKPVLSPRHSSCSRSPPCLTSTPRLVLLCCLPTAGSYPSGDAWRLACNRSDLVQNLMAAAASLVLQKVSMSWHVCNTSQQSLQPRSPTYPCCQIKCGFSLPFQCNPFATFHLTKLQLQTQCESPPNLRHRID